MKGRRVADVEFEYDKGLTYSLTSKPEGFLFCESQIDPQEFLEEFVNINPGKIRRFRRNLEDLYEMLFHLPINYSLSKKNRIVRRIREFFRGEYTGKSHFIIEKCGGKEPMIGFAYFPPRTVRIGDTYDTEQHIRNTYDLVCRTENAQIR